MRHAQIPKQLLHRTRHHRRSSRTCANCSGYYRNTNVPNAIMFAVVSNPPTSGTIAMLLRLQPRQQPRHHVVPDQPTDQIINQLMLPLPDQLIEIIQRILARRRSARSGGAVEAHPGCASGPGTSRRGPAGGEETVTTDAGRNGRAPARRGRPAARLVHPLETLIDEAHRGYGPSPRPGDHEVRGQHQPMLVVRGWIHPDEAPLRPRRAQPSRSDCGKPLREVSELNLSWLASRLRTSGTGSPATPAPHPTTAPASPARSLAARPAPAAARVGSPFQRPLQRSPGGLHPQPTMNMIQELLVERTPALPFRKPAPRQPFHAHDY